ncbi:MAG: hypothetical protein ACOY3Y_06400 [Acidobacteriota bacterium]
MARTTVDIDDPVLRDVKRLQRQRGQSLGRVVSDLLARALSEHREPRARRAFQWTAYAMGVPRVDLRDKEALNALLDADRAREP